MNYTYWPDGLLRQRRWGPVSGGITADYSYDLGGRLSSINYSDGTMTISYNHDRAGRLETTTDAAGTHGYVYQNDGTVTETVTGAGTLLNGLSLTKRVNGSGQLTGIEWSYGGVSAVVTYDYLNGKLDSAKLSAVNSATPLVSASYDYHAGSARVHHLTRPIAGGAALVGTSTLDAVGRADVISWQRGTTQIGWLDYTLNAAGRRWKETRLDGTTLEYSYNDRGEVSGVVRRRADETLRPDWSHGYEYDATGNRTLTVPPEGEQHYRHAVGLPTFLLFSETKAWLRGRAHPQAVITVNGAAAEREGELWRKLLESQSGRAVEAVVSASRPDLTPAPPAVTQTRRVIPGRAISSDWQTTTGTAIEHDWNGNLTDDGLWTYQWDAERRPVVMEERFIGLPGETQVPVRRLEMVYDAQGRRVSKKLMTNVRNADGTLVNAAWAFERETIFLWQDWMLLAEFVRLTEAGSPALRRSYLWGLDVSGTLEGAGGVGGLLWVADHVPGETTSHRQLAPCYDGNGNILSWVENEGAELLPLHRLEYDPFGQTLVDDPARVARTKKQRDLGVTDAWLDRPAFGFSTKYEDRETGLLYYGYRYYNPELGRWLSRDPINERGGLNLYGMVGNDPVNQWDLHGMVGGGGIGGPQWVPPYSSQLPPLTEADRVREGQRAGSMFGSDAEGRYLLDHYLNGRGRPLTITSWKSYMTADNSNTSNPKYRQRFEQTLRKIAANRSSWTVGQSGPITWEGNFELANGEGVVGYDYLHGTNTVIISGTVTRKANHWEFDAKYNWKDEINKNTLYLSDIAKNTYAEIITLGVAAPYNVEIKWESKSTLGCESKSQGKGWPFKK